MLQDSYLLIFFKRCSCQQKGSTVLVRLSLQISGEGGGCVKKKRENGERVPKSPKKSPKPNNKSEFPVLLTPDPINFPEFIVACVKTGSFMPEKTRK